MPHLLKALFAFTLSLFCLLFSLQAQELPTEPELTPEEQAMLASMMHTIDSIEASLTYLPAGESLSLGVEIATLVVPAGYKYLDPAQSAHVLTEIWGNPSDGGTLGMLLPEASGVLDEAAYAINITYDEMGYVEDDEAEDLDYDQLLETMQEDTESENEARMEQGYGSIELVGWASPPYYDAATKKLHWAKELVFDGAEVHTLNYNVRMLGRHGVLEMNFIAGMEQLAAVQKDIPLIMPSVSFKEGMRYDDFDPEFDEIAAVGIGGLIAGKALAKVGVFAFLGKFGKLIIVAVVGFFGWLGKRFFGRKNETDAPDASPEA